MRGLALALVIALAAPTPAHAADRTFDTGSLIIPMDLSYQATGSLQAYGLLYQLLRANVRVYWVIDPNKTYHAADCDTVGDQCAWACNAASAAKCPYPTASPDFSATTKVVWSDAGTAPNTVVGTHAYRGGPFVIDSADKAAALVVINAWNANTPARPVFHVVSVHETTAPFTGNVSKEMVAAPTIAVFADGRETIAAGYLRSAGIPQTNGQQFSTNNCTDTTCGPGTSNPDMLMEEAIMGPLGTCSAPNTDHKNGALWRSDGLPAYCQIMSMHWDVTDRERVECDGGCGNDPTDCNGQAYTYHGHEVVAEVRAFLGYPVHFFAECQAVNAYENTVQNPAYPFLDDAGRDGHFLTTTGTPPACTTTCATGFTCVNMKCEPQDIKEKGAGFLISTQPNNDAIKVLRPDVPYNQFDGAFGTTDGSEPSYNLSTYLMTMYKNNRQVTLLTGGAAAGDSDVWMSGYLDGACDIILSQKPDGTLKKAGSCNSGKISYLGGHDYTTNVPITSGSETQGTRLFLNALFEADCVTAEGQPNFALSMTPANAGGPALPITQTFTVGFANQGPGFSYDGVFGVKMPGGVTVAMTDGAVNGSDVTWQHASISGAPAHAGDPASDGSHMMDLTFAAAGDYAFDVSLQYRVGTSTLTTKQTFTIHVGIDSDGDGVPDDIDPDPNDPNVCGDADGDGCDDCAASCDGPGGKDSGCCDTGATPAGPSVLAFLVVMLLARRRRVR